MASRRQALLVTWYAWLSLRPEVFRPSESVSGELAPRGWRAIAFRQQVDRVRKAFVMMYY
eukprot:6880662-Pyramimonas_sp.AAC.1